MRATRATSVSFIIAAIIVVAAAGWLWRDYRYERQVQRQLLDVRGQTILSALEGGLRSHRRFGPWMMNQLNAILEETAQATGILGLAVFDQDKDLIASGGLFPPDIQPTAIPQWREEGRIVSTQTRLQAPPPPPGTPPPGQRQRRGDGQQPPPPGQGPPGRPPPEHPDNPPYRPAFQDEMFDRPVWLVVLLDPSDYQAAVSESFQEFIISFIIITLALILALTLVVQLQRGSRLSAELHLAQEREQRLEELTRLGAGLAHETKNPLSIIRGLAQSWRRRPESIEESQRTAQQIIDEADRIVGRINGFLNFARPQKPDLRPVALNQVLQEIADIFKDEAHSKGVQIRVNAETRRGLADPAMLRQLLVNVMANALAACEPDDAIELSLKERKNGRLDIEVRDSGQGIAPSDMPYVTKPYFTRREGGTGLGLAIVEQIAQSHNWEMSIDSIPKRGTTVRISGIQEPKSP